MQISKDNPFKIFSLIFSLPTEEIIEELKRMDIPVLSEESKKILKETDLEKLKIEYTRVFVNAFPKVPCPPYESYYREGNVYGETSIQVEKIYKQHGLKYSYEGEPPDHISVELEFMALKNDQKFLERLKQWIPKFTECVKKNSEIYAPIAKDLENFIKNA